MITSLGVGIKHNDIKSFSEPLKRIRNLYRIEYQKLQVLIAIVTSSSTGYINIISTATSNQFSRESVTGDPQFSGKCMRTCRGA